MISALAVSGYRSLRDVRLELGALNVVTGAHGSGRSSLYRALRLLADVAQGRVVASLAAEGGMPSAVWAGPKVLSRAMLRGDVPVEGQRSRDRRGAPELLVPRERMRAWRFYDHLRTDRDAPARHPQVGTRTMALSGDGADLAAPQTVREIGDARALDAALEDAFPGSVIAVADRDGPFDVEKRQPGLLRPLGVAELSEGTLRYLLQGAALLSPRPAPLMVLNEPEASLHPDLIAPLARLIGAVAARSQGVVVSHAPALVEAPGTLPEARRFILEKRLGETVVEGEAALGWVWPEQ